jgi:molybdate-binding protein
MFKLTINERITRYLENYNENNKLQYIPVHPEDYEILLRNNELQNYSLPIVKLGEIY